MNLAKVAYEAYSNHTGWKSLVSGQSLPQWEALSLSIQQAWEAAASGVVVEVSKSGLAQFGQQALESVKEAITEGHFHCDAEALADMAVDAGLIVCEPYDPERHKLAFGDDQYEPGDMIYYWE
jgi:anti-sigma28 factor (negative regulator of flagellin synthesis)